MQINKVRFFHDTINNKYVAENITWKFVYNDERAVSIGEVFEHPISGEMIDSWIPMIITNAAFDTSLIKPLCNTEDVLFQKPDATYEIIQRQISVMEYRPMDAYSQPLKPGYVAISMEDYNNGIGN